jgi:hypothetical protein
VNIKQDAEPVCTDDFWYDMFEGGYIEPDNFLEIDDASKVKEAMWVIQNFKDALEDSGLIEEM